MPELIEVELYRRAAEMTVGRRIETFDVLDRAYVRGGDPQMLATLAEGHRIGSVGRIGKLMMTHLGCHSLGWRFGMTGRLMVDGYAPIEVLQYSSNRDDAAWDRVVVTLDDGVTLRVNDPRRLGSIELDPDVTRLGPDAATLTARQLRGALDGSTSPIKARLLDQRRVSGLGNLLVDEALWRSRLDPRRPAGSLSAEESTRLATTVRRCISTLTRRGGSHMGDLMAHRIRGGRCPRCGEELDRRVVGGRTTYSCPAEQR